MSIGRRAVSNNRIESADEIDDVLKWFTEMAFWPSIHFLFSRGYSGAQKSSRRALSPVCIPLQTSACFHELQSSFTPVGESRIRPMAAPGRGAASFSVVMPVLLPHPAVLSGR